MHSTQFTQMDANAQSFVPSISEVDSLSFNANGIHGIPLHSLIPYHINNNNNPSEQQQQLHNVAKTPPSTTPSLAQREHIQRAFLSNICPNNPINTVIVLPSESNSSESDCLSSSGSTEQQHSTPHSKSSKSNQSTSPNISPDPIIDLIKSLSNTPPPHPSTFLLSNNHSHSSHPKTECLSNNQTQKVNTINHNHNNQSSAVANAQMNLNNETNCNNGHSMNNNNNCINNHQYNNEFHEFSELGSCLEIVWEQCVARRLSFLREKQRDRLKLPLNETSVGPRHKARYRPNSVHPIRGIKDLFVPDRIIWMCGAPCSGRTSVSHTVGQSLRLHHLAYIDYDLVEFNESGEEREPIKQYEILFSKILHKSYKAGVVVDGFLNSTEHAFVMHFLKLKLSQIYGYIRFIVLLLNIDERTSIQRQTSSVGYSVDREVARKEYQRYGTNLDHIVAFLKNSAKFKFELIDAQQPLDTVNRIVANQVHFQSYTANGNGNHSNNYNGNNNHNNNNNSWNNNNNNNEKSNGNRNWNSNSNRYSDRTHGNTYNNGRYNSSYHS